MPDFEDKYELRETAAREGLAFTSEEDLRRERELEDLLLELDIVTFAGATKARTAEGEPQLFKIIVGTAKQFAHLIAPLLDATLKRAEWAEAENVHLEVMVVRGRPK